MHLSVAVTAQGATADQLESCSPSELTVHTVLAARQRAMEKR